MQRLEIVLRFKELIQSGHQLAYMEQYPRQAMWQ